MQNYQSGVLFFFSSSFIFSSVWLHNVLIGYGQPLRGCGLSGCTAQFSGLHHYNSPSTLPSLTATKMELQFQTNWGPLTAVGVPLLDLKAAVELAVGAYGWWKARERVKSLALVLRSAGCELSHCSTFDTQLYFSRFALLSLVTDKL